MSTIDPNYALSPLALNFSEAAEALGDGALLKAAAPEKTSTTTSPTSRTSTAWVPTAFVERLVKSILGTFENIIEGVVSTLSGYRTARTSQAGQADLLSLLTQDLGLSGAALQDDVKGSADTAKKKKNGWEDKIVDWLKGAANIGSSISSVWKKTKDLFSGESGSFQDLWSLGKTFLTQLF